MDLECGTPAEPESDLVWEAEASGIYFIRVRSTTCDEDLDHHCMFSPDGIGLGTEYTVSLL